MSALQTSDKTKTHTIRKVTYFYTMVEDRPGEAYALLSQLAALDINLLAFTAIPVGPDRTQLSIFPADEHKLAQVASRAGFELDGPHPALLVQGDDELGALVGVHQRLRRAGVNVYASNGVTDGKSSFGYVIYVRPDEFDQAVAALGL